MNAEMARAEDERAEREAEIARDENYANDVNGLAAALRVDMETERLRLERAGKTPHMALVCSSLLTRAAESLRRGESGDPVLAVFDDWGFGAICTALKRAVDEPQPGEP